MSADLPLEEPERRLRAPAGPVADTHVWERRFLPWDCYFAVVWVATVLFALAAESPGPHIRLIAAGLFGLLVPWYAVAGRRLLTAADPGGGRRQVGYITGLVVLFLPPAILVGETRLATFALVPQCFMLLRIRDALAAVAVINVTPVLGWALVWRPDAHVVYYNSVFAAVTLAFSAVLGSWIIRIIEQSAERAELLAELRASREQIGRLSAERGALAERERLSREIHDTLAQGFTSLLMLVQAVDSELDRDPDQAHRHLELMARTARENLAEARALVAGGAPAGLDGSSLADAVRRLAARHAEQTGAPAVVEVTGTVRGLPAAVEVVALRTCQEALANVRRHAGSGAAATLRLHYAPDALALSVQDDGRGFSLAAPVGLGGAPAASPSSGYGLPGLRARAAELGGTADVAGAPGRGTTVSVTLPLERVAMAEGADVADASDVSDVSDDAALARRADTAAPLGNRRRPR
ncbi:sensor histidine kinase [Streptomyces sp. NBC_01190]|uniref:sensor histidine kinase n=1 Tax=Streptomyces sp. NBC_01190 TaxID=2903767 RepID=UPI00386A0CAC|nr:sensor histidine kinase [Streptomyces sp. NBC_01190]